MSNARPISPREVSPTPARHPVDSRPVQPDRVFQTVNHGRMTFHLLTHSPGIVSLALTSVDAERMSLAGDGRRVLFDGEEYTVLACYGITDPMLDRFYLHIGPREFAGLPIELVRDEAGKFRVEK